MAVDNYDYRNQASLGGTTQYTYDNIGLGQVVPVGQPQLGEQKMNAVNGLTGNGPKSDGGVSRGGSTTTNTANGGGTATVNGATPVRANAFQKVGGKGMTIDQRRAAQENNNILAGQQMLNASAQDNFARAEQEQNNTLYANGELPENPNLKTPLPHETNLANYYRQQQEQQPAWGNDSQGKEAVPGADNNDTSFEAFRRRMYDEDAIRRESDKRAKVYAVGDVLRNLGNLYYTAQGASPQKFSTAPGTEERERYETGRQNRDALAYQYWQADQKQRMNEAEQKRKDAESAANAAMKEKQGGYYDARTQKLLQDMKIDATKAPYEIQKLVGDAATSIANGNLKDAEAQIKTLELQNKPLALQLENQLKQAKIGTEGARQAQAYSGAAKNYAQMRHTNALTAKVWRDGSSDTNGQISGKAMGSFTGAKDLKPTQKSTIVERLHKEGIVTDDIWNQYKNTEKLDDEDAKKLTADDIIAKALEYTTWDKYPTAKAIFEGNGMKQVSGPTTRYQVRRTRNSNIRIKK